MKPTQPMVPTLLALALTGCAADPLTGEPSAASSIAKGVLGMAARGATESETIESCADRAQQNGQAIRAEAVYDCQRTVRQLQSDRQLREKRASRKEADALQQAFDQRKQYQDTTSVAEKRAGQKSWIEQHEAPERSIIELDSPTNID